VSLTPRVHVSDDVSSVAWNEMYDSFSSTDLCGIPDDDDDDDDDENDRSEKRSVESHPYILY